MNEIVKLKPELAACAEARPGGRFLTIR